MVNYLQQSNYTTCPSTLTDRLPINIQLLGQHSPIVASRIRRIQTLAQLFSQRLIKSVMPIYVSFNT